MLACFQDLLNGGLDVPKKGEGLVQLVGLVDDLRNRACEVTSASVNF
jgi:hypothetical protein